MKVKKAVFLLAIIAFFLFWRGDLRLGAEQKITYLPKNEKVDIVSMDLGIVLTESDCADAEELFKRATECFYCVNTLKVLCPDCCLVFNPVRSIQCSPEADPDFPCDPAGFSVSNCNAIAGCGNVNSNCSNNLIPLCQRKGCGDPEPEPSAGESCIEDGSDSWICTEDNLLPSFAGCLPTAAAQAEGLNGCSNSNFYSIQSVACPAQLQQALPQILQQQNPPQAICYQYTLNPNYGDCLDDCHEYCDNQESCEKKLKCCMSSVCDGEGFDSKCRNSEDPVTGEPGACDQRIDWPGCDDLTSGDCVEFNNEATQCLTDTDGKCHACFRPISEDFFYKFVARSREKVIVMWQITSTPRFQGDAPTYFYTMIKIIDDTTGEVIHESIVNQKSFQGSFSIFSATSEGLQEGEDEVLETGKPYTAMLYYFIPPIGRGLSIQVDKVQMIIVRTRN